MLRSEGNYIFVEQVLGMEDFHRMLATIHNMVERSHFADIVLDFTNCQAAFAGPMLAISARIIALRKQGISTKILLPSDPKIARLFRNTNWAYLLDPENFAHSDYQGREHVSAIAFTNAKEQQAAVTKLIDIILETTDPTTQLDRGDLAAIEWALSEVTDNVLTHAQSPLGGIVQLSRLRQKKLLEIVVVDYGLGIPNTLRSGYPQISDTDALSQSIQEGVTRDPEIGQGNGLFGTYELARVSGGFLELHSGYARLSLQKTNQTTTQEPIPMKGTLLVAGLRYGDPNALAKALRFSGRQHHPSDSIEIRYEMNEESVIRFLIREEVESFRSRPSASPLRTKIENLRKLSPTNQIVLDFLGISLVSSSFADELVGKLFLRLGPTQFMNAILIVNANADIRNLLDRAILQRSATAFPANGKH